MTCLFSFVDFELDQETENYLRDNLKLVPILEYIVAAIGYEFDGYDSEKRLLKMCEDGEHICLTEYIKVDHDENRWRDAMDNIKSLVLFNYGEDIPIIVDILMLGA